MWEGARRTLLSHFGDRRYAEGILACVREVGRELARCFPKKGPGQGPNELPDEVTQS